MNRKVLIYKINYNSSLIQYGAGKKMQFIEFKLDEPLIQKTKTIVLDRPTDEYELDYIKQKFFFYFRIPIKSRNNLIKILHAGKNIINEDSVVVQNKPIVFVMKNKIELTFKFLNKITFKLEFFSFNYIEFVKKMVIDMLIRQSKRPLENDIELYFKTSKLNERERINSTELMNNPIIIISFKMVTGKQSKTLNEKERENY